MTMHVTREQVWTGSLEDRPGALAEKLERLAAAGVDLKFILARRSSEAPRGGILFVSPITGDAQEQMAAQVGLDRSPDVHKVSIEAPDGPGLVRSITARLAEGGINLRGVTGTATGGQAVIHLALDSEADADRAVKLLIG